MADSSPSRVTRRSTHTAAVESFELHALATNSLQRCLTELAADRTNYGQAIEHIDAAIEAVKALAVVESILNDEPIVQKGPAEDAGDARPGREVGAEGEASSALPGTLGRRKAYCAKLSVVVARYLDAKETEELAATLQRFAEGVIARRYCPGLNDAVYDLFARFAFKGGAK